MLFPYRPLSLLLLALLGASGLAMAGPQDPREQSRERSAELRDSREVRDARDTRLRELIRPEPRQERRRARQEDLSDSVRRIERRTRGQVLSAERVPYEGRDLNRIKVIDENGRVRVFMDDPAQRPPTRGDDD